MKKLLLSILLALAGLFPANAQLSFTISVEYSGSCRAEAQRIANTYINQYKPQATGIPTMQQCEQIRNIVNGINYIASSGRYSCGFRLKAGPCTGRPVGMGAEATGQVNIQGLENGGAVLITNGAVANQYWSEDEARRRMGLDKEYQNEANSSLSTGDSEFDNARWNKELTGRMPTSSINFIVKDSRFVSAAPSNGAGVKVPDDFLSKPFVSINLREGGSSMINSEDFSISKEFLEMQKREQERIQRELEIEQQYTEIWDEIKSKLDDENYHLLKYFFQSFFGDKRPKLLKITEKGEYVFESEDENKLFSISNDATVLQTGTFEEHSWDDENIMKAIQEDGFKDVLSDRFEFECPILDGIKGGKISFKDLKKFSPKELKKLLPYIKAGVKLKLFDNSSKISYEYMQLNVFDSNIIVSGKGTLEGGGKDDISFSIKGTAEGKWGKNSETGEGTSENKKWETNKEKISKGEESDYNINRTFGPIKIKVKAKAEIGLASIEGKGTIGIVKKLGNSYFYCSGGGELKGGLKISSKTFIPHLGLKRIIYGEGNIGGFQCKNITKSTDNNIPYLQKNESSEK